MASSDAGPNSSASQISPELFNSLIDKYKNKCQNLLTQLANELKEEYQQLSRGTATGICVCKTEINDVKPDITESLDVKPNISNNILNNPTGRLGKDVEKMIPELIPIKQEITHSPEHHSNEKESALTPNELCGTWDCIETSTISSIDSEIFSPKSSSEKTPVSGGLTVENERRSKRKSENCIVASTPINEWRCMETSIISPEPLKDVINTPLGVRPKRRKGTTLGFLSEILEDEEQITH